MKDHLPEKSQSIVPVIKSAGLISAEAREPLVNYGLNESVQPRQSAGATAIYLGLVELVKRRLLKKVE